ncbi:MAG: peptidoglycan-binding protein [Myxococcaceae bacterium]|nr:peptidoglycan-binding protein [Myxococcaceae bacterium]
MKVNRSQGQVLRQEKRLDETPKKALREATSEFSTGRGRALREMAVPAAAPVAAPQAAGPLSREQLAQVFYQAGFRGEDLVSMVAISMRESGGNPGAFNGNTGTGDQSYGLTQINMIGANGPWIMELCGLTSPEQLFDPVINAQVAFKLAYLAEPPLRPWGPYKGESPTFNCDVPAARAAVANAEAQGLLGQPFDGGGAVPAPPIDEVTPPAPTPSAHPVLRIGARGEDVKVLQQLLIDAGFNPGPVDGWFGPKTQAAVRAFQQSRGITVDGWVGPQTWGKLDPLQGGTNTGAAPGPGPTPVPTPPAPVPGPFDGSSLPSSRATTPAPGVTPVTEGPREDRLAAAVQYGVAWAQLEAENPGATAYVGGASPFRYGGVGDGSVHQYGRQKAYLSPEGQVCFDCSGFVVAMYRQAGVDISGIGSSGAMLGLPEIGESELQPGDLIVKDGHVVVYIGDGMVVEASPMGQGNDGSTAAGGIRIRPASDFLDDPAYSCHRVPDSYFG